MPDLAGDLDAELQKALKGPTMGEKLMSTLRSILEVREGVVVTRRKGEGRGGGWWGDI